MSTECTQDRFLKDVANHKCKILLDEGMHRHLHFSDGSCHYHFKLITWPGYLCICGDMGTFVFSRLDDMFCFFRGEKDGDIFINRGYWSEKLSQENRDSSREYSADLFKQLVTEDFESFEIEDEQERASEWEEVRDAVLYCADEGEYPAMRAAIDFKSSRGRSFHDFWEHSPRTYTYHFTWICFAIVWGIRQYDRLKEDAS